MRLIRRLLMLGLVVVAGVFAYNYWTGNGWTLQPARSSGTGVNAEEAREKGAALAREAADTTKKAAETTKEVAERAGEAIGEATLTAKIKSKMALDDYVKARDINVDSAGTVVTLSGTVHSDEERQRAVRLARETEGVTKVLDKLQMRK